MTYPRHMQVSLRATPYYHCVARCVRRAWLWGYDEYAGRDYSHRKQWVLERLQTLAQVFAIDVTAYAVMSNHLHVVLHLDRERAERWTLEEVVHRWGALFGVPPLVHRGLTTLASADERESAIEIIESWRGRLYDISWYMRCLNEYLARRANEEDNCKGRFWEGRFKSQALLDEAGLLTAMAYVDLNPVRAGMTRKPEEAEFTSIYQRIREIRAPKAPEYPDVPLQAFQDALPAPRCGIPFTLVEYLELVDWAGRVLRKDHRGAIDPALPSILRRLGIHASPWVDMLRPSGNAFGRAIGRFKRLRSHSWNIGQGWIHGMTLSRKLFGA